MMIEMRNVSMQFNLAQEQFSGLKDCFIMLSKGKLKFRKFRALKNINLKIKRGESWGLIGENGCGKSTLLKLVSGIYRPSTGEVLVHGSIAPLIELGAGFDFELTARENIYLNGAVLGYDRNFMNMHMQEIIDFSELQEFMDIPIKNFSSGMIARLGFSIATVVRADILVIDEILAVGDVAFQEKCQKKMQEIMSGGTTVLFVSHDAEQVVKMCKKAAWLKHGEIMYQGNAKEACRRYKEYLEGK